MPKKFVNIFFCSFVSYMVLGKRKKKRDHYIANLRDLNNKKTNKAFQSEIGHQPPTL